jgi:hypothetical protein
LNFYKDSELLQTFVIYNKKNLNISLNILNDIRSTIETDNGISVGITNILFKKNTNSLLKQAIETNFTLQTSETNYVSQMKYIGLLPNSDKNSEGLSGIANFPGMFDYIGPAQNFINGMNTFIYQEDNQIIPKNYYYSLSKFINEPILLRRVAKLMSANLNTSPIFDYYDLTTAKTGIHLPGETGLQTYRSIFARDRVSGRYFVNYFFTPIFSGILQKIGEYALNAGPGATTARFFGNLQLRQSVIDAWRTRLGNEQNLGSGDILSGSYLD